MHKSLRALLLLWAPLMHVDHVLEFDSLLHFIIWPKSLKLHHTIYTGTHILFPLYYFVVVVVVLISVSVELLRAKQAPERENSR